MDKHDLERDIIMKLYKEVSGFDEFGGYEPWSGAVDTVNTLREHDKLEEAWQYIESIFDYKECVDEVDLNDLLWFEASSIYEAVGLTEDGEEPDEVEEEEKENMVKTIREATSFNEFCEQFPRCSDCPFNDCSDADECEMQWQKIKDGE